MKRPDNLSLAIATAELAAQADAIDHELAGDLRAVLEHVHDELTNFHRSHDVAKPAAPAWFLPGGVA